MGYEKFTWVIKNFSYLKSAFRSNNFVIGGCKWYLVVFPKGYENADYLSLYMVVYSSKTLPCGWRRHTKYRLTVVNQLSDKLSQRQEKEKWFDHNGALSGFQKMLLLTKLNAKEGGFLVNNEVEIVVEVDVLQVIGKLDVLEESQEITQPLKRLKLNGDSAVSSSVDVNGFQVLHSQVESVKHIFKKHPDMALEFRAKNQHMRTLCINLLLNIVETLCQSLQDFSIDDLGQAEKALTYLKDSGFKVDWLDLKLEEVKKKKMEEQFGKTRMQKLEEELKVFKQKCSEKEALLEKEKDELKDLKQMCSDTEAMLEKEKSKVLAASRAPPLTLDDVF